MSEYYYVRAGPENFVSDFMMVEPTFSEHIEISISCVLEDIARLRKLKKKNPLDGFQSFSGARLLHFCILMILLVFLFRNSTNR